MARLDRAIQEQKTHTSQNDLDGRVRPGHDMLKEIARTFAPLTPADAYHLSKRFNRIIKVGYSECDGKQSLNVGHWDRLCARSHFFDAGSLEYLKPDMFKTRINKRVGHRKEMVE
jgi:hypothetical protein